MCEEKVEFLNFKPDWTVSIHWALGGLSQTWESYSIFISFELKTLSPFQILLNISHK